MLRKDAPPLWVPVEATTAQGADGPSVCRAVVITECKRAQQLIQTHSAETLTLVLP